MYPDAIIFAGNQVARTVRWRLIMFSQDQNKNVLLLQRGQLDAW